MARTINSRNLKPVLDTAEQWIRDCLVDDRSVLSSEALWTQENVAEVRHAFIDHPDEGADDFSTKLKGQMKTASPSAQKLTAEMLWALLLFPSNIRVSTKQQQVRELWSLSGETLPADSYMLSDEALAGIGSGGTGYNTNRWRELKFLIHLVGDLKQRTATNRQDLLSNYDSFIDWVAEVPQEGDRQFRHMLRTCLRIHEV